MVYLLVIEEVHFRDVDNAIAFQFASHLIAILILMINQILVKFTKIESNRIFTYSAVVLTSLAYYGCIIYCQVMFLRNFDQITEKDSCGEKAAIDWMTLEIMFFYMNILFTIVYLFLHSTVGLRISKDNSIFTEPP